MKNTPFYHVSYSITRHVALERGERNRRHKHAFYEPCIVLSGSGEFEQNGVIHAINEGDLFIGDADTFHEIRNLGSTALELYFVCFYLTWHVDKPRVMRQALLDQDQANQYVPHKKKATRIRSQESIHRYLSTGKLPRYPKSQMNVPARRRRKRPARAG